MILRAERSACHDGEGAHDVQRSLCNLVFSHTLLGDYLDPEELRSALAQ